MRQPSRILFMMLLCWQLCAFSALGAERRPGLIKTSDGVELRGEVWFSNGEFKVYEGADTSDGKYFKVNQSDLASITFSVKKSTMEKPWRFKNAGSDEKEFLDGQYPLIELKSDVKLKSGKILQGHLMTVPVMIRIQGKENPMDFDTKKFPLKYQYKGDVGQALKDISYVTSIQFVDAENQPLKVGEAAKKSLSGFVKGLGKLQQVVAYSNKYGHVTQGNVDVKQESFTIEVLPDDNYDIAILTDRAIYIGFSEQTTPSPNKDIPRPLEENDHKAVDSELAKFLDFFEEQKVLALKGHRDAAKALTYQTRVGKVNDQAALGNKIMHRLDIWRWHLLQTEWRVDTSARVNLFRYEDDRKGKQREVKYVVKLGAIASTADVKFEINTQDVSDFSVSITSLSAPAKTGK